MGEARSERSDTERKRRWAAIELRLEAASEVLSLRGSIASRLTGGLRVYSVRYTEPGPRRQRAVYLGRDGELVRRTRALIGEYRERERQTREVEESARFTAVSSAFLRRLLATRHRRSASPGES